MVVPGVKVGLIILSLFLYRVPALAGVCTTIVQAISKWACPDMFAYILLLYLIRGMNHPRMLRSEMQLDLGFTCFSLFCVGSTIASLGMAHAEKGAKESSSSLIGHVVNAVVQGRHLLVVAVLSV